MNSKLLELKLGLQIFNTPAMKLREIVTGYDSCQQKKEYDTQEQNERNNNWG
jgi:hypothetical protein